MAKQYGSVKSAQHDEAALRHKLETAKKNRDKIERTVKRLERELKTAKAELACVSEEVTDTHALLKYELGIKDVSLL